MEEVCGHFHDRAASIPGREPPIPTGRVPDSDWTLWRKEDQPAPGGRKVAASRYNKFVNGVCRGPFPGVKRLGRGAD